MRTPLLDGRIVAVPIFCPCALTMSAWAERAACWAIAGVQYTAIAAHRQNPGVMLKNRRIGMNLLRNLWALRKLACSLVPCSQQSQYVALLSAFSAAASAIRKLQSPPGAVPK